MEDREHAAEQPSLDEDTTPNRCMSASPYTGSASLSTERSPLLSGIQRAPGSVSIASDRVVSPIIAEDDESITIRQPVTYNRHQPPRADQVPATGSSAFISRLRYYGRLAPYSNSALMMPNHVVPSEYYLVIPITIEHGKQGSLVTIFSIWNTMMGTSILSMPWALERAGFGCGIALMIFMACLSLYTAYRVMTSPQTLTAANRSNLDFSDVCRHYIGRWAEILSIVFSLVALLGAVIVYWVLMSNFLYHTVTFIHDKVTLTDNTTQPTNIDNATSDVQCVIDTGNSSATNATVVSKSAFDRVWQQNLTVPVFLIIVLFPLINFKSPTFFTKFNALGTVSVAYILIFVSVKAAKWGFHMNFSSTDPMKGVPEFQWTFPALTGILSLAYFIHNAVISIVKNQKNPENNGRDLTIAFACVAFTYIFVGVFFYSCFPLPKICIEDNLLNNFRSSDIMAFVARIFLFFQMTTVFPLLMFIFRIQIFGSVFGNVYPSVKYVILLNCFIIGICVMMAILLPKIGTIIRFSGALCGLVYVYALPSIVYILYRRSRKTLTVPVFIVHIAIVLIGILNFVAQFLIKN